VSALLRTEGMCLAYGGVQELDNSSIEVKQGSIERADSGDVSRGSVRVREQQWPQLLQLLGSGHVPGTSELKRVSCLAANGCVAVGTSGSQKSPAVAAAVWNGTTWRLAHPALPAGATLEQLSGISCPGPARCLAVGGYASGSGR